MLASNAFPVNKGKLFLTEDHYSTHIERPTENHCFEDPDKKTDAGRLLIRPGEKLLVDRIAFCCLSVSPD